MSPRRVTYLICTAIILLSPSRGPAAEPPAFGNVVCEGDYQHHLQGVCTNETDAIYWSFTTQLVKTDARGKVLKKIPVANHHGDLCFHDGKLFVAVNLGKFNDPKGNADSWVYVYDAEDLKFVAKHETQEVFHGAGGIGVSDDRYYVVGGLPDGVDENYVYEYDEQFKFVKKHIVKSGWTRLGIQTATFHDGAWWFGCYGSPKILLKTDARFKMQGRYEFDCSLGIVGVAKDRLLVAKGPRTGEGRCLGSLHLARPDEKRGLLELSADQRGAWRKTRELAASEAIQAAAADKQFVYAVASRQVAKYDRASGRRISTSTGEATHLNSAFLWNGKLLCAHSNYPKTPERSEIKVLDPQSMQLSTFKEFGNAGGSLTWVVRYKDHWWCNFARYGDKNAETFVVKFDDQWREQGRWIYPKAVIDQLGRYSLSGGLWYKHELLVTGHDKPECYRLRLPQTGTVLEYAGKQALPFTGQGFAQDPEAGGLVGISRARRQVIFVKPSAD